MQDSSPIIEAERNPAAAGLPLAIVGGLVGAVIGGVIWALVGVLTEREVGYVAIGVGALAGYGVLALGRQKGPMYQIIAVAMSVIGIFLGKYYLYYHFNKKDVVDTLGQEAWDTLGWSLLSSDMIDFFIEDLPDILGGMDLLFFGLAMLVAFGIPSAKEVPAKNTPSSDDLTADS